MFSQNFRNYDCVEFFQNFSLIRNKEEKVLNSEDIEGFRKFQRANLTK